MDGRKAITTQAAASPPDALCHGRSKEQDSDRKAEAGGSWKMQRPEAGLPQRSVKAMTFRELFLLCVLVCALSLTACQNPAPRPDVILNDGRNIGKEVRAIEQAYGVIVRTIFTLLNWTDRSSMQCKAFRSLLRAKTICPFQKRGNLSSFLRANRQ